MGTSGTDWLGIGDTDADRNLFAWLNSSADAVAAWNDEAVRTFADVVITLHEAADDYDKRCTGNRTGGAA